MRIIPSATPISPSDRAFNYGDGVFSTLLVHNQKPQLYSYHLSRLEHDAAAIKITVDTCALETAINDQIAAFSNSSNDISPSKYVLKVHVSGGQAGRGYARSEDSVPLVRFSQHPYPAHYEGMAKQGMSLICAQTRLAIQPLLAGVKHMNRLEQVLIKHEVNEAHADDALVCDTNDNLIEASAGNVFFYSQGEWYTPSLKGSGVNGVVRQCLIDSLLNNNHTLHVGEYQLSHIGNASAVVITNALMGVMPVKSVRMPDHSKLEFDVASESVLELSNLLARALR